MSNILSKDSSEVSYAQKLIVSKKFDNFAKITLRVTETGPSRILGIRARTCRHFLLSINTGFYHISETSLNILNSTMY